MSGFSIFRTGLSGSVFCILQFRHKDFSIFFSTDRFRKTVLLSLSADMGKLARPVLAEHFAKGDKQLLDTFIHNTTNMQIIKTDRTHHQ